MKSRRYSFIYRYILLLAGLMHVTSVAADTVNVAVAANFSPTLKLLATEFERTSGHRIQVIAGSSGSHYAQIINGAPFDLFLSADSARPAALVEAGVVAPAQRRVYALGRLALWSRDPELVTNLDILGQLTSTQRVAIANPRLAPYGEAAEQSLQYLGLVDRLKNSLVMGENVGQTFQFVYSGNAAVGFVAYSQVLSAPESGSFVLVPDVAYEPIVQEMVLLRPSAAAQAMFDYLSSADAIAILENSGYHAPRHP